MVLNDGLKLGGHACVDGIALNQLFEKIMHLDIDERHLLRLGHGEEALETEKDLKKI